MARRFFRIPDGMDARLRDLCYERGLSQAKVAERLGVHRHTVADWCNGRTQPNAEQMRGLCLIFKVSADFLIFGRVPNI